jgi:hypothetical protein
MFGWPAAASPPRLAGAGHNSGQDTWLEEGRNNASPGPARLPAAAPNPRGIAVLENFVPPPRAGREGGGKGVAGGVSATPWHVGRGVEVSAGLEAGEAWRGRRYPGRAAAAAGQRGAEGQSAC